MRKIIENITSHKRLVRVIGVLAFGVGLLLCGLTLAYFTGQDAVTNRHQAKTLSIQLLEPQWQESGYDKAQELQPGMVIEKDPTVYNDCEEPLYIRMRLVVQDADGKTITGARYQAILDALYYQTDTKLISANQSQNPAFVLEDGWFYYYANGSYTVLDPGQQTPALFTAMHVPMLKTDYHGTFDTDFRIVVVAQAVSATYTSSEAIKVAFAKDYQQAEITL